MEKLSMKRINHLIPKTKVTFLFIVVLISCIAQSRTLIDETVIAVNSVVVLKSEIEGQVKIASSNLPNLNKGEKKQLQTTGK